MSRYTEIDLTGLRTYSSKVRTSKVALAAAAVPPHAGMSMAQWLDGLPKILKARDLKLLGQAVVQARRKERPVLVMLGGHVIKTGCSPVLIDLLQQGWITHLASNGAAAIHDCELACFGHTSEEVASQLRDGSFGMAADTAALLNGAARRAADQREGLGEALGALLLEKQVPFAEHSLVLRSYQCQVPYTLHVALGTDIVHQHADADGAAIGEASLRDFRIFCTAVSGLGDGGVVLNLGSAVIMPEVFLKAMAVSRNLGYPVFNFTTANFDMLQHYRPTVNVLQRPVQDGGQGFAFTGHHEIMLPLLAAVILETAAATSNRSFP